VTYIRDRQTARDVCGVRLPLSHALSKSVHAHRTWLSDSVALTWCGIEADMSDGASQTTDLISCLSCSEGSWKAFRSW
jgi:hypothetical protein